MLCIRFHVLLKWSILHSSWIIKGTGFYSAPSGTARQTNLFESADQLLVAQCQVLYRSNHTAGCREEEQARVQACLSCLWHQNNLHPWRNLFLSKHLKEEGLVIVQDKVLSFNLVLYKRNSNIEWSRYGFLLTYRLLTYHKNKLHPWISYFLRFL